MKSEAPRSKSEVHAGVSLAVGQRIRGLFGFAAGVCCIWFCLYGFDRLLRLMEGEGTKSWTVEAGPFGVASRVLLVTVLVLVGISSVVYAIRAFINSTPARARARA